MEIESQWKDTLKRLPKTDAVSFVKSDAAFGRYLGEKITGFLSNIQIKPDYIASHGHTIFHFPEEGVTTQIGNGAMVAGITNIPVIDQFRWMDVALGGQGAPVAPIADKLLFKGNDFYLNLGGIANISSPTIHGMVAFDICGANQILNALAQLIGLNYDEGGKVASTGNLNIALLKKASENPYFERDYPKSLDNEWVFNHQIQLFLNAKGAIKDKLHTACLLISHLIAKSVRMIFYHNNLSNTPKKMFITGGGAFNHFLVSCIEKALNEVTQIKIVVPNKEIVEYKEAIMIALMGALRIKRIPNCLSTVTGARKDAIGGIVHWP